MSGASCQYAGLPRGILAEAIRAAATIAMPQFGVYFERAVSFHGVRSRRAL